MQFFCAVCMQAMTHSVDNVSGPLVVVGRCFVVQCWVFLGRPGAMKNGLNWGNGFVVGDANTKIVP